MILEVCASSIEAAQAAAEGGAQRIELCKDLELDGLTPPQAWIEEVRKIEGLKLHVLIRPREGNFVYSEPEFEQMRTEIRMARKAGADGVVIGALNSQGNIDVEHLRPLMAEAKGMQVTFHRAFDVCQDPMCALEQIISLGCTRLLTSGQQSTAEAGIPLIRKLVSRAAGRIIVLAGAGVNPDNAARIVSETGVIELHSSARKTNGMGIKVTDPEVVAAILNA